MLCEKKKKKISYKDKEGKKLLFFSLNYKGNKYCSISLIYINIQVCKLKTGLTKAFYNLLDD